ncbi:hypothetical protein GGF41_006485, partial [Coemansia sp. RSA 2531]
MAAPRFRVHSDCVINSPAVVPFRVDTRREGEETMVAKAAHNERQPMFIGIGGGRGAGKEFTCRYIIDKVRERGYGEL